MIHRLFPALSKSRPRLRTRDEFGFSLTRINHAGARVADRFYLSNAPMNRPIVDLRHGLSTIRNGCVIDDRSGVCGHDEELTF